MSEFYVLEIIWQQMASTVLLLYLLIITYSENAVTSTPVNICVMIVLMATDLTLAPLGPVLLTGTRSFTLE